ncbi:hypothetical protein BJ165DRAFT_643856 [Panaeolus papilionaceus]|nr:hypothetical protein BJ165DRAFT_643856 [Panaeolus papilionaceus]
MDNDPLKHAPNHQNLPQNLMSLPQEPATTQPLLGTSPSNPTTPARGDKHKKTEATTSLSEKKNAASTAFRKKMTLTGAETRRTNREAAMNVDGSIELPPTQPNESLAEDQDQTPEPETTGEGGENDQQTLAEAAKDGEENYEVDDKIIEDYISNREAHSTPAPPDNINPRMSPSPPPLSQTTTSSTPHPKEDGQMHPSRDTSYIAVPTG